MVVVVVVVLVLLVVVGDAVGEEEGWLDTNEMLLSLSGDTLG